MKKLLLLFVLTSNIFNCQQDDSIESQSPTSFDIEGKWLFSSDTPGISDQGISNTMYIFENGIRYTYYCVGDDCETQYQTFEAGDSNALPTTNQYTFEDGILTIDLNFGNIQTLPLVFECDGNRINFQDPDSPDRNDWVRLEAINNNCN